MKQDQNLLCPKCFSERYYVTGSSQPVNPPNFEHRCFDCNEKSYSKDFKTLSGRPPLVCMSGDEKSQELEEVYGISKELSNLEKWKKMFLLLGCDPKVLKPETDDPLNRDTYIDYLNKHTHLWESQSFTFHDSAGDRETGCILATLRKKFT